MKDWACGLFLIGVVLAVFSVLSSIAMLPSGVTITLTACAVVTVGVGSVMLTCVKGNSKEG